MSVPASGHWSLGGESGDHELWREAIAAFAATPILAALIWS